MHPHFATFCIAHNDTDKSVNVDLATHITYLVSAVVGVVGALVYIAYSHMGRATSYTHRKILKWLAVYDVLACLFIFVRSALFLWGIYDQSGFGPNNFMCGGLTTLVDVSYFMTFAWTICFAWEACLYFRDGNGTLWKYHVFAFSFSGVFAIMDVLNTYFIPVWTDIKQPVAGTIYIVSFCIPILITMIVNPVIYTITARAVKMKIMMGGLHYTNSERERVQKIRERFFWIVIVFYFCWLVSLADAVVAVVALVDRTATVYRDPITVLKAVLNPMQSLLNATVYRGCRVCPIQNPYRRRREGLVPPSIPNLQDTASFTESTTLLSAPT